MHGRQRWAAIVVAICAASPALLSAQENSDADELHRLRQRDPIAARELTTQRMQTCFNPQTSPSTAIQTCTWVLDAARVAGNYAGEAHVRRAAAYAAMGDVQQADEDFMYGARTWDQVAPDAPPPNIESEGGPAFGFDRARHANAHCERGDFYWRQGDTQRAIASYRRAQEYDPQCAATPLTAIAAGQASPRGVLRDTGRYDPAAHQPNEATEAASTESDPFANLPRRDGASGATFLADALDPQQRAEREARAQRAASDSDRNGGNRGGGIDGQGLLSVFRVGLGVYAATEGVDANTVAQIMGVSPSAVGGGGDASASGGASSASTSPPSTAGLPAISGSNCQEALQRQDDTYNNWPRQPTTQVERYQFILAYMGSRIEIINRMCDAGHHQARDNFQATYDGTMRTCQQTTSDSSVCRAAMP